MLRQVSVYCVKSVSAGLNISKIVLCPHLKLSVSVSVKLHKPSLTFTADHIQKYDDDDSAVVLISS